MNDLGIKSVVIGGAGAIGSNLVNELLNQGENVLVLDNLSSGNINEIPESTTFIYCDIRDKKKLEDILVDFQPQYIYNLAAHFANQNSVDYIYEDTETNVIGVLNVLEACAKLKSLEKYVYASSSCVYGNQELMTESDPISPYETPYAINKYVGELYSNYYSHYYKLPIVNVRIFNTYGPGEHPGKYRNVIPNFISKALNNEVLYITGDGCETRDFTYVKDTCQCLIKAARSEFVKGEVFNSGTGIQTSIMDLARKIIDISGSLSEIKCVERRAWDDVLVRSSNINRSKNDIGYSPEVEIDKGLIKTIEWHKK